jgi:formamidopyrimidine-DNA glycosylase
MPEYPDIVVYVEALQQRIVGRTLDSIRVKHPFLLRTVAPGPEAFIGLRVERVGRLGKRVVVSFERDHHLVIHLMIAGRLHWFDASKKARAGAIAEFAFDTGTLTLTESGSKRRASIRLIEGGAALAALDPGGIDPIACTLTEFRVRITRENHTLKRVLTDPRVFSGIGNAYSDEILHRARLSPVVLTRKLDQADMQRLLDAARAVLAEWTERLRSEASAHAGWPPKVTAFHPQMAVHGRYGQPCPVCGSPVQRIVHQSNETNYCARCQTGGKLLADRALSRLLHASWPKTIDDLA